LKGQNDPGEKYQDMASEVLPLGTEVMLQVMEAERETEVSSQTGEVEPR
jgi:hypothetical protein